MRGSGKEKRSNGSNEGRKKRRKRVRKNEGRRVGSKKGIEKWRDRTWMRDGETGKKERTERTDRGKKDE